MKVAACDSNIIFTEQVATCSGNWSVIEVSTSLSPFDPATLDPALIADAFGAGFLIVAVLIVFTIPLRLLLKTIKGVSDDY